MGRFHIEWVLRCGKIHGNSANDTLTQTTALTLFMRLVKEEGFHLRDEHHFPYDLMARIARAILYMDHWDDTTLRDEFVEKYLDEYHDLRYSFFFVTLWVL